VVYAGDNLGNLWKFDLTSANANDWKVAFGDNKPLFTTLGPVAVGGTRNQAQPITAPPIVRANDRFMTVGTGDSATTTPVGGIMVAFGTGRNLTANDRRTDIVQNVQTLYSVLDNTRYRMKADKTALEVHPGAVCVTGAPATCIPAPTPTPVGSMTNDGKLLAQQTITTVDGDFSTVSATQELTKAAWATYKGWYLDLPFTGERMLKPMQFFDGSNILAVYTESPSGTKNSESDNINESCVPVKVETSAGSQFRTLINIMDGKPPSVQLVDYDNNGLYNAADKKVARAPVKTGTPVLITKRDRIVDLTGGGGARDTLNRMPEQSMRPSWRQLR
jgi:type IV pilus assembly protein PilY1